MFSKPTLSPKRLFEAWEERLRPRHTARRFYETYPASGKLPGNRIAIAAIFRNEATYIAEWLEFHRTAGIDHFYLYDNNSEDGTSAIASRFSQATVLPWNTFSKKANAQRMAYAHAARNCSRDIGWLLFVDVDEFVFPPTASHLEEVFEQFTKFDQVLMPRYEFGTNGHKVPPSGSTLDNFTLRAADKECGHKAAIRPHALRLVGTHHSRVIGQTKRVEPGPTAPLRINHYFTRSESEFVGKLRRGWPHLASQNRDPKQRLASVANQVEDRTVLNWLSLAHPIDESRHGLEDSVGPETVPTSNSHASATVQSRQMTS